MARTSKTLVNRMKYEPNRRDRNSSNLLIVLAAEGIGSHSTAIIDISRPN